MHESAGATANSPDATVRVVSEHTWAPAHETTRRRESSPASALGQARPCDSGDFQKEEDTKRQLVPGSGERLSLEVGRRGDAGQAPALEEREQPRVSLGARTERRMDTRVGGESKGSPGPH